MKMGWVVLLPLAFVAGMALPTQFAVNSQLRGVVGGPVLAADISFVVGTVVLLVATVVIRRAVPDLGTVLGAPWWMYIGGLLGAGFVLASVILTPRLGAATTVGFFLAGQVVASMIIDHFGLFRAAVQEVTVPRILGALLILAGVFLVQRF
jgi:bacterial/archaeal transporter family-2 protein